MSVYDVTMSCSQEVIFTHHVAHIREKGKGYFVSITLSLIKKLDSVKTLAFLQIVIILYITLYEAQTGHFSRGQ